MEKVFELNKVNYFNLKGVPTAYIEFLKKWKDCDVFSESEEYVRHLREYTRFSQGYKYIVINIYGEILFTEVYCDHGYYNSDGEPCYTGRKDDILVYNVHVTRLTHDRYLKDIALNYRINNKHRKMAVLKKKYPEIDFRIL